MPDEIPWRARGVIPTLQVRSLDAAVAYYADLGFHELWRYPSPSGDEAAHSETASTHVGIALGGVTFMLAATGREDERIERQNIYLTMDNVRHYHADLRERLGSVVPDLIDSDYGMVDFALTDPWGHLIAFGDES